MCNSKNILRWYNNSGAVPTLKDMQKLVDFYHIKGKDIIKFRCILPNLAKISLRKSPTARFHSFTENDNDLLQKMSEDMPGGTYFVFTREALVDETLIRCSARSLLELLPVNLLITTGVKQFLRVCSGNGNYIQNLAYSKCNETRRRVLRTLACRTFRVS